MKDKVLRWFENPLLKALGPVSSTWLLNHEREEAKRG